jgi:hypothetical protein
MTGYPASALRVTFLAVTLTASALSAETTAPGSPAAASPGSAAGFTLHSGRCPTFNWGAVPGAERYELVVYQLGDAATADDAVGDPTAADAPLVPVVGQFLPGSVLGWTPPLERCPEAGGHYAWAVRASVGGIDTDWSETLLFRISTMPSVAEVEDALAVLQRFVAEEGEGNAVSVGGARPRGPSLEEPARDVETASDLVEKNGPSAAVDLQALLEGVLTTTTVGSTPQPRTVTPPGSYALSIDGDFELAGHVFKDGHPFLHGDGGYEAHNLGLGWEALVSATPSDPPGIGGRYNTAVGSHALGLNTTGYLNTAAGAYALAANTTGGTNTAFGVAALLLNTVGVDNTAIGGGALRDNLFGERNTAAGRSALGDNASGFGNTAVGYDALRGSTSNHNNTAVGTEALRNLDEGDLNVALGFGAGEDLEDGHDNIYIGNSGETTESDTIRIGDTQTATFVAGVRGTSVGSGIQVLVGALGRLGTTTSSRRFKEEIADMGDASAPLLALRPVTFRYTEAAAGDGPRPLDFGLIAEEVAELYPDLVAYDEEGKPYSVRYHVLPAMLLNELQKLDQRDRERQRELGMLRGRLRELEAAGSSTPPSHGDGR